MIKNGDTKIEFYTMGLFTTDDEWIHPERTEVTYEVIFVTEGDVYLEDNGVEHHLKKGNLIVLRPGVMHRGYKISTGKTSFYWLHFYCENLELPYILERFSNSYLFRELIHYCNLPDSQQFVIDSILSHLIAQIQIDSSEIQRGDSKLILEIIEWIRINADATLTVAKTAKHFGYNPEYLTRLFKKSYSVGIKKLIDDYIIKRAKEYLANTNYSVKEIAVILKFSNANLFTNFFKYHEHTVPLKYRNTYLQTHMNNK